MQVVRSSTRSWARRVLAVFLIILFSVSWAVIFFDRVGAFYINHFTDFRFEYDEWGPSILDRSNIKGAHIVLKGSGAGIRAGDIQFDFNAVKWIIDREAVLSCQMKGVTFEVDEEEVPRLLSPDSILAIPFNSLQEYDSISFKLFSNSKVIQLSGFNAHSENIRMKGDYSLFKDRDEVSVDFKISFSPEFSASFNEDIRENVLSLGEDGWYSTIINYKGNALLLKALYTFTIAP